MDHGVQMDVSESSLGVILLDEELEVSEICGDEPAKNKVKLWNFKTIICIFCFLLPREPPPFLFKVSVWSWLAWCSWSCPTWWSEIDLQRRQLSTFWVQLRFKGDPKYQLWYFMPALSSGSGWTQISTLIFQANLDLKWLVLRLLEVLLVAWYTWCQDLQSARGATNQTQIRILWAFGLVWQDTIESYSPRPRHGSLVV